MPRISVIVPAYQVEKYIYRCVDSILAQTFTDLELILVDDGSTDKSGVICDEYAVKDGRVRVIHQKNGGAAAARNVGIDAAQGEYLAFCDSDDVVSAMWLQRLVEFAGESTLPVCAYCKEISQLGSHKVLQIECNIEYPRKSYYLLQKAGLAGYLCNALYKRGIVQDHGIRLREQRDRGDYNEDLLFALTYVQYVDQVIYTGYADYLYDTHEDSLSRGSQKYYFEKYAEKYKLWNVFLRREYGTPNKYLEELSTSALYHFLVALRNCNKYEEAKRIVCSDAMQTCVSLADAKRENPREIAMIKGKRTRQLWFFYELLRLKGKITT